VEPAQLYDENKLDSLPEAAISKKYCKVLRLNWLAVDRQPTQRVCSAGGWISESCGEVFPTEKGQEVFNSEERSNSVVTGGSNKDVIFQEVARHRPTQPEREPNPTSPERT